MVKESDIPREYRTGKTKPAKNVAELIALLQVLPPKLKISYGFGDKVSVGVTSLCEEGGSLTPWATSGTGRELRLTLDEVED